MNKEEFQSKVCDALCKIPLHATGLETFNSIMELVDQYTKSLEEENKELKIKLDYLEGVGREIEVESSELIEEIKILKIEKKVNKEYTDKVKEENKKLEEENKRLKLKVAVEKANYHRVLNMAQDDE